MMKHVLKVSFIMIGLFFLFACSGSNGDQNNSKAEKSAVKTDRQPSVHLIVGNDIDTTMTDAEFTTENGTTTVVAGKDANMGPLFTMTFKAAEAGPMNETVLNIKGYHGKSAGGTLMYFSEDYIAGMMQGIVQKTDENGKPQEGDIAVRIDFRSK